MFALSSGFLCCWRSLEALLLLEALPGDAVGMKQAPSSQAAGSVQWGEQCWLPVGFVPVMEGTEATVAWGWKGE